MTQQNQINIRPAVPDDCVMLLELIHQHADYEQTSKPSISMNKLSAIITDGSNIKIWVATEKDTLIGYFSLTEDYATWTGEKYLHLDCLFLHQNYRKQGLGSQLFKKIKGIAMDLNITQIQWQTPIENTSGIAFYQRQGAIYKVKSRFTLEY